MESDNTRAPSDLSRFVDAQAGVYDSALAELRAGAKRGHWMWFLFPQVAGLGRSPTAKFYALAGAAEARDYLADALLSRRLIECTLAVLEAPVKDPGLIFGEVDALKFRSCMTLFASIAPGSSVFHRALDCFYDGEPDVLTLKLLR